MSFISLSYYLFLGLSLAIYLNSPKNWRTPVLVCTSFLFYLSFNAFYIGFIVNTVVVSYLAARIIDSEKPDWAKKAALLFSILIELSLLFITKYWNPLAASTNLLNPINILIPLGISFYSFQSIGYVVDVYRGKIKAEKDLGKYSLFVTFFPHLLAGPIEPAHHFIPQLYKSIEVNKKMLCTGALLILAGLFKKLVVADNLRPLVDLVFDNPGDYKGAPVAFAVLLAKYQIYADFSGYTDIALGSALLFGFELVPNFNRPFFSKNITEYRNRWHMSLSAWIKNYIFYPLLSTPATILGAKGLAILTFLILGLWHGGTYNFLIYGFIQGLLIAIDSSTKKTRLNFYKTSGLDRYPEFLNAFSILFTFFVLVVPPTLFFRAADFTTATKLVHNMNAGWSLEQFHFIFNSEILSHGLLTAILGIIAFEFIDWVQKTKFSLTDYICQRSMFFFCVVVFFFLIIILMFGKFESGSSFIYTQF